MLSNEAEQGIGKIPLFDNTVRRRIIEMSSSIKEHVSNGIVKQNLILLYKLTIQPISSKKHNF